MGVIDKNGVYIYSADDTVNSWEAFLNLGQNSVSNALNKLRTNSLYKATDITQANSIRDNLTKTGITPSASNPILVYLTSNGKIIAWDGNSWKQDGNALSSILTSPSETTDLKITKTGNGYLCGVKGTDDKIRMEAGSYVATVQANQNNKASGSIKLQNKYTGIQTFIGVNGDPYTTGNNVLSPAAYWLDAKQDNNGYFTHAPFKVFGVASGINVRINYMLVGWVP